MIDSQKLQAFQWEAFCAKCGAGQPVQSPELDAEFKPPEPEVPPHLLHPTIPGQLRGRFPYGYVVFPSPLRTVYCAGGKEPESEEQNPLVGVFKMATGALPEQLKNLSGRTINICAGIGQEHLHRICSNCGYEFLMQCKDATQEVTA